MGLVLKGQAKCKVSLSLDAMKNWSEPVDFVDGLDLTDQVKGHYQYWLRFHAPAQKLGGKGITIKTLCMANGYVMPHLKGGGSKITFNAGNKGYTSIGPQFKSIHANLAEGALNKPSFAVSFKSPAKRPIKEVWFMSWNSSWIKPKSDIVWKAEVSIDGKPWQVLKDDWRIKPMVPYKPKSTWSQSYFYGGGTIDGVKGNEAKIRISNNKGRPYFTGRFWLVYDVPAVSKTKVTFCWDESGTEKKAEHIYSGDAKMDSSWTIPTGKTPVTKWIEMEAL